MIASTETRLDRFDAPYGRVVTLEDVAYENGTRVLRVHIREGRRFTVMDIDENTATRWGAVMCKWAGKTPPAPVEKA
jgi:hypothetical protein